MIIFDITLRADLLHTDSAAVESNLQPVYDILAAGYSNENATDYQKELVVLTQDQAVFTIVMNRGCVVQLRSTNCRRSSMRKWRNCTSLHAVRSSQYFLRNKQITSVASLMAHSKVGTTVIEMQGSAEVVVAGGGLGVRVVDMRVETQPIWANSSPIELVLGILRMLEKFLGTVSSWTKRL